MRFLLFALIFLGYATTASAAIWSKKQINGRSYVTIESIARFYKLSRPVPSGNGFAVTKGKVRITGQNGANVIFINGLRFVLSFPVEKDGGGYLISQLDVAKLIDPVMRPNRIRGAKRINTVVLDAGHGGHDRGARSYFGDEKDFALDVALRTKSLLTKKGLKVVMTRTTDRFIPLETRANIANAYSNAIFISIHFNSGGSSATGIETYAMAPQGAQGTNGTSSLSLIRHKWNGNRCDELNAALATTLHNGILRATRLYDRGVKRARFAVLRQIVIPGALVECGFLSNPSEARKVAMATYRTNLAKAISRAVIVYKNAVSNDRATTDNGKNTLRMAHSE